MIVDESFAAGDDAFVERVRTISSPKYLAALADRWKKDPRPWAREQIFRYLALPLDRPGHQPVVKRLFKHAEKVGDDRVDGGVSRRVRSPRAAAATDALSVRLADAAVVAGRRAVRAAQPDAGRVEGPRISQSADGRNNACPPRRDVLKEGRLFSYATRHYLRRRVWRYFRRLGFQKPAEYPAAVAAALARYRDEDVAHGREHSRQLVAVANLPFAAARC